jgi:hypothetical protein
MQVQLSASAIPRNPVADAEERKLKANKKKPLNPVAAKAPPAEPTIGPREWHSDVCIACQVLISEYNFGTFGEWVVQS